MGCDFAKKSCKELMEDKVMQYPFCNDIMSSRSVESGLAQAGLLMGDDIGSVLLSMVICFDFCSTNVVHLSNRNPYFYWFRCQLIMTVFKL